MEGTETFDIGLDGPALFNNRMTFEIAYWRRTPRPSIASTDSDDGSSPTTTTTDNIGRSRTPVSRLTVGVRLSIRKDWNWHSDINFSTVKNTVKELYGGTDIIDNYTIIREGEILPITLRL